MNVPQLTAEHSIYKTSGIYRSWRGLMSPPGVNLSQTSGLLNGTYQQSCQDCSMVYHVNGGVDATLSCSCEDFNGNLRATSLDYALTCAQGGADIANCNGNLLCGPCENILN